MSKMNKKSREFLFEYLNNSSPTGYEQSGQQIWLDYIKPYTDSYFTDIYGTAVAVINPKAKYKVVIEAHADEIAWTVHYITEEGYIYVKQNGGSDAIIAPSKRVNIYTDKGIVKGVFGWPAIHVRERGKADTMPEIDNIFLDVGATTKTEVEELGIHVGCVATFEDELMELNDKFWTGRALDNRIGGFMIAEVARKIHKNKDKLDFGLYVVNAVQEEVGLNGAMMISRTIEADVAIVTDVCHDTASPMYNKIKQSDIRCGRGGVLTYAPAVQNNLLKHIIKVAEENKIPFQRAASSRVTGTDTDAFAYSGKGTASALISIPLKYMHTTVETASKQDVEAVIDLMYQSVISLKAGTDFRYIK
jgi:putative aminopeptidase FrvX